MREIDFLDAVGRVNKRYIEECITYKQPKKMNVWIGRMSAVAACLAVIIGTVLIVNHMNQPVIIDENGFYIENGVLLKYTGSETDITIPEEVETIADYTFIENTNANKIEIVRLGASVQEVETNAFAGLENLVDLVIAVNNLSFVEEDGLIMTSDGSILLRYKREGETKFTIPDSVRIVAAHAVQATELEEIDFGENLEYIGYNAFASNYKLKAIYLPDSVKYICKGAFASCSSAVDGYIPSDAQIEDEAFYAVPFYNTMLAGQMCPYEEIIRGLITPSEAILKSDMYSLTEQFNYVLATLRGDSDYEPSEAAMFGYAAANDAFSVPEGMIVPTEISFDEISFKDRGWGNTGKYDLQILIPAGEYTIVVEAYGYALFEELYWEDARFRLSNMFYIKNEISSDDVTDTTHGWTAVFEKDGDYYKDITFIHEDGTVVHHNSGYLSEEPYVLTYSPDGTRVIVEYDHIDGFCRFYVVILNTDKVINDMTYVDYMDRYFGKYTKGSAKWIDNDNIEGENIYGRFTLNIYKGLPVLFADYPEMTDPNNRNVIKITHDAIGYRVDLMLPEVWQYQNTFGNIYYYDAVICAQYKNHMRAGISIEDKYFSYYLDGKTENDWLTNENGVDYLVVTDNRYDDPTVIIKYNILLRYEGNVVCNFAIYPYEYDPDNYFETVIQPIIDSAVIEPKGDSDNEIVFLWHVSNFDEMINGYYGDSSSPINYPHIIKLNGLSTEVEFNVREYDLLSSISAYGQTVEVNEKVNLYGNHNVDIFEADGAIIFTWSYYNIGYTYILGDGFTKVIEPVGSTPMKLYTDETGNLRYMRTNNQYADIVQTGGLSAATGYDDFLYCSGNASIEDGKLVLDDADEYYTIGDKYDLDLEFNNMYSRYYDSIQSVFEEHKLYPGGAIYKPTVYEYLLTMTAAEIRSTYGSLKLEYSEHGPGQPVYSMKYLPGVLLVFHNWNMDDPLTDDMVPSELIITEEYSRAVHGITIGSNIEDCTETILWSDLWYHVINGTANLQAEFSGYTVTYTISGENLSLPAEDTAHEYDWDVWEADYIKNPTGRIVEIRIEPNK